MISKVKCSMKHILGNIVLGVHIPEYALLPTLCIHTKGRLQNDSRWARPLAIVCYHEKFSLLWKRPWLISIMFSPNTVSCSHKIYFLPRPLVWVWWGSRVWSPGICPQFNAGMLLYVTFSWAARWEQFFLFLWGGDGSWDADLVLGRVIMHWEKHGPMPQTANPQF